MTEEEAIQILNDFKDNKFKKDKLEFNFRGGIKIGEIYKMTELNIAIQTVLNSIVNQKEEIENKDKIMEKAAEDIDDTAKQLDELTSNFLVINQAMRLQKIAEKLGKFYID